MVSLPLEAIESMVYKEKVQKNLGLKQQENVPRGTFS
jgi:hypothetical protein